MRDIFNSFLILVTPPENTEEGKTQLATGSIVLTEVVLILLFVAFVLFQISLFMSPHIPENPVCWRCKTEGVDNLKW